MSEYNPKSLITAGLTYFVVSTAAIGTVHANKPVIDVGSHIELMVDAYDAVTDRVSKLIHPEAEKKSKRIEDSIPGC